MADFNEGAPLVVPAPLPRYFTNVTIRQTLRLSVGGDKVRIHLSNAFGTEPLVIDGVHLAKHRGGTDIDPSTDVAVTFGGKGIVTIPAHQELWSDEIGFPVVGRTNVTVSIYVEGRTPASAYHPNAFQRGGIAAGNALSVPTLAGAEPTSSYYWLSGMDVRTGSAKGAFVAFGDSITDGGGLVDANQRYPNRLDDRIAAGAGLGGLGVVNAGLAANRLLNNGLGPRGLDRFDRDVLQVSNARGAVILMGINDILQGSVLPGQNVSAEQVVDGLAALVGKGRAAGLKMYLATLLPCKGFVTCGSTEEAKRAAVNAWIRANSVANGVIDWGCLNFCVRGGERLFHGGGRRLRRTDRRGGKVGAHSTQQPS